MASYITNGDADTYFATRYPVDEWDAATEDDKTRTLATATRLIDQLNFAGSKTVSTQENEFPRNTSTTVPTAIKNACCEIAYSLLEGYEIEVGNNVKVSKFGQVTVEYDVDSIPLHIAHNIPSSQAWNYIRPYLNNTQAIKLERLS